MSELHDLFQYNFIHSKGRWPGFGLDFDLGCSCLIPGLEDKLFYAFRINLVRETLEG